MFGQADFGENEFAGSVSQNVFTLAFNEAITMTDSLIKGIAKLWSEAITLSETMIPAKLKTFTDALTMSEQFKKLLNGVSTVWSKEIKTAGSWTKTNKITDIWKKIRKQ